jgi:hypothetical protein
MATNCPAIKGLPSGSALESALAGRASYHIANEIKPAAGDFSGLRPDFWSLLPSEGILQIQPDRAARRFV